MTIRDAVYRQLAYDTVLVDMLAAKPSAYGTGPAIYETWAAEGTEMPYINLTYFFQAGEGVIKREGTLDVDIFYSGYDSTAIERIQRRVIELLDLRELDDPDDGPIRIYLGEENDIPEDTEGVMHWNITFSLVSWRRSFISHLENR